MAYARTSRPAAASLVRYWAAHLLLVGWPYKVWFESRCIRARFTFVKEVAVHPPQLVLPAQPPYPHAGPGAAAVAGATAAAAPPARVKRIKYDEVRKLVLVGVARSHSHRAADHSCGWTNKLGAATSARCTWRTTVGPAWSSRSCLSKHWVRTSWRSSVVKQRQWSGPRCVQPRRAVELSPGRTLIHSCSRPRDRRSTRMWCTSTGPS